MSMERLCDLHVHSHFSDGTFAPGQLLQLAQQAGLSAIALTDHNTVDGLPEFMEAAGSSPVEAVPGIEFSVDFRDVELHILGLFIKPCHYEKISAMMDEQVRRKEESNLNLVAALRKDGYELDYEKMKASTPNGFVNRALVAAALTEKGYTPSIQDAFRQLLSPKGPYYVPPKRPDAYEMIGFIRSIGAAAVWAHPFLQLDADGVNGFLPKAVEMGLQGMEVYYPKYDAETTRLACQIADTYGLLPSGGSDFHGSNKPDIQIGTGRGELKIPYDWLEAIRKNIA